MTIATNPAVTPSATVNRTTRQEKKYYSEYVDSNLKGFIHHPAGFPLEFRRLWFANRQNDSLDDGGIIGLCFESDKYIKPGTTLEVSIPLRGVIQKFRGKVVLVRWNGETCEIGMWLSSRTDAGRIRIVEQICHIEAYLKHKRHREGPFISPERVAQEWITRFASSFPSLG
jgi:hypothetical protein